MATTLSPSQVAPVPAYNNAIIQINQNWTGTGTPSTAARIKIAMMLAGIPVTNNNAWANLLAQSNFEYPSGPVGNNLFGTSLNVNGSHSTNGDGVQSYQTWQDGVYAAAKMFQQSNMAPMYASLINNDPMTPATSGGASYEGALGQSCWEGCADGPAPNVSYGQAVAARYTSLTNNGTLKSLIGGAEAASPGTLSPSGEAGAATPGLNYTGPFANVVQLVGDILDGFGLGWKAILTIIGGILLVGVGVLLVFRRQATEAALAA